MADMRSFVVIIFLVCLAAGTTTPKQTSTTTSKKVTSSKPTQPPIASTTPTVEEICAKLNTSCKDCVGNSKCLYCKTDSSCRKYPVGDVIPGGCDLADARWGVCWVNFEALLIAAGVIGGIILISLVVVIYCCCCRSKSGKRYEKDDAKFDQQKMERKVKQDERRTERSGRLDEIRRKYGLVKDDSPYNRLDA